MKIFEKILFYYYYFVSLSYGPHPDEAHRAYGPQHNYLSNSDFGDEMSGSTKYALFADPFDDSDEDFIDSSNRRFKVIPVEMNEWKYQFEKNIKKNFSRHKIHKT